MLLLCGADARRSAPPLRVCADPNNLPFSNAHGEGFENRIAALVARDLHRPLDIFLVAATARFHPQHARRRPLRHRSSACRRSTGGCRRRGPTTARRTCSSRVAIGSCASSRSTIARLQRLTIGIQIIGDDYDNPPAGAGAGRAASRRQCARLYRVRRLLAIRAAARDRRRGRRRRVDVAVVWGPMAGYFARREPRGMDVDPVAADRVEATHWCLRSTSRWACAARIARCTMRWTQ